MKYEAARQLALSLPEATAEPHSDWTSFKVRGKRFASAPPDGLHMHVFVDPHEAHARADQDPEAFAVIHHGPLVLGVRVTLAKVRAAELEELLTMSWKRKAPKGLSAPR